MTDANAPHPPARPGSPDHSNPPIQPYQPRVPSRTRFVGVRGLRHHLHEWGDARLATPQRPTLVMVHGWMDVGASFQFVVDALAEREGEPRHVIAPDWRGFGRTEAPPTDSYWFPDYLGDLDGLLDALNLPGPLDLAGHSMGGNVSMLYAGVRPQRIRRLMNLEGFGMPRTVPVQATRRLAQWLDQLKTPQVFRDYASAQEVAARLMKNDPRLSPEKAAWLAPHWWGPGADGRWRILGDPAHKRVNPVLYRVDEVLETWKCIEAPVLWVEGSHTDISAWWGQRYARAEVDERLAVVKHLERHTLADSGHMMHHDQPEALAALLAGFLA